MSIAVVENVHPLIKAVGEAIANPTSFFFLKPYKINNLDNDFPAQDDLYEWQLLLNPNYKTVSLKDCKLIASYSIHDEAEKACETFNNYNLAKYALKALNAFVREEGGYNWLAYDMIMEEVINQHPTIGEIDGA